MRVNWETKLVRVNTMTSRDYDALAYVVKKLRHKHKGADGEGDRVITVQT